jgi:hypothetical protein
MNRILSQPDRRHASNCEVALPIHSCFILFIRFILSKFRFSTPPRKFGGIQPNPGTSRMKNLVRTSVSPWFIGQPPWPKNSCPFVSISGLKSRKNPNESKRIQPNPGKSRMSNPSPNREEKFVGRGFRREIENRIQNPRQIQQTPFNHRERKERKEAANGRGRALRTSLCSLCSLRLNKFSPLRQSPRSGAANCQKQKFEAF